MSAPTPLIVARFDKGFIVGTNEVLSVSDLDDVNDGARTGARECKVLLVDRGIAVRSTDMQSFTDRGKTVFDLDQELAHDLANKDLSLHDLRQAVVSSTEESIRGALKVLRPIIPQDGETSHQLIKFENHFIIVGVEKKRLSMIAVRIEVFYTDKPSFIDSNEKIGLKVGEILDWENVHAKISPGGRSREAANAAVKKHLEISGTVDGKKIPGFEPPYSIVELDDKDRPHFILVDPSVCHFQ